MGHCSYLCLRPVPPRALSPDRPRPSGVLATGPERPLASAHALCPRLQSPPKGPSRLRAGCPGSGRSARSVSLVQPATSDPAGAGRVWEALAAGGRRLLQRDPGAGPGAAWAAGRCESGRGGAGTRRLYRGRVVPHRSLRSYPRKPQAGGLAADPGAGDGDPGWERGRDLRIRSGYLENRLLPVLPFASQTPPSSPPSYTFGSSGSRRTPSLTLPTL